MKLKKKNKKETMSNIQMKKEDNFRKLISEESVLRKIRKITEQNGNTNTLLGLVYEFLKNWFFSIPKTLGFTYCALGRVPTPHFKI